MHVYNTNSLHGRKAEVKPLTDVSSKWTFLDAICLLQGVAGSYYSSSNMWLPFACNELRTTVNLQWFTCDANFHSIPITIASSNMSYHQKSSKNPRLMVENWMKNC